MPTAKQWQAAVEKHRRRRTAALSCCDECLALGKTVYPEPEDEELWALLPGEPEGRPLLDALADEPGWQARLACGAVVPIDGPVGEAPCPNHPGQQCRVTVWFEADQ